MIEAKSSLLFEVTDIGIDRERIGEILFVILAGCEFS
jgi:hypothetical protein